MSHVRIVAAGDSAVVLRLGDRIDPAVNARALLVAHEVSVQRNSAVRDVVVGYASVTVYFDPLLVAAAEIEEQLRRAARQQTRAAVPRGNQVDVPVHYGGDAGPDLDAVASFARCSTEEVIAIHSGREYRVFMLGFLPGFPYMGIVDERIAMPRRETPRVSVPGGSVAIAGLQTGIYPVESPGGWRLIGRTDVPLFDPLAGRPTFVEAGDVARFVRAS